MRVTFKGQHIAIPQPIKDHASRRIARLDRYLPPLTEVVVELRREDTRSAEQRYIVQATLNDDGSILRAEERARDMEQAVDATVEKLSRQARRYKRRRQQRDRTSLPRSITSAPAVDVAAAEEDEEEALEAATGRLVRVKRFAMKPMTVDEAIEQLSLLGHDFFLFFSADENTYALLYRRADTDYGLILPDAP
jgi:putative sigma-54 modulation protein